MVEEWREQREEIGKRVERKEQNKEEEKKKPGK